jgi:hypothetical protein
VGRRSHAADVNGGRRCTSPAAASRTNRECQKRTNDPLILDVSQGAAVFRVGVPVALISFDTLDGHLGHTAVSRSKYETAKPRS